MTKYEMSLIQEKIIKSIDPFMRRFGHYCRFQYSETFKIVRKGLYTTIERMYLNMDTRIIIDEQLEKFKNVDDMFGMDMAKLTRDKKQPGNLFLILYLLRFW
ncbi:hypothetical protein RHGRI_014432 [Rhododendron griersonianum]|uniref:Uncharacterized protein n=1 Tax=Rhododendron griersonianum TaxID=479676 RepID=A0AAV6K9C8_9ERIC|nr:hypothetical protein RHGRI_014432 [Rhododendron griersonianum]